MDKGNTVVTILFVCGILMCWTVVGKSAEVFTGCRSSAECPSGQCCAIGGNRYSVPQCLALREVGESCRPGDASTVNTTLFYPDGTEVTITDVHFILCPCADDLSCDSREGVCQRRQ